MVDVGPSEKDKKIWTERVNEASDPDIFLGIGRMPLLSPQLGDLFYQRLLLKYRRGATSFKDLRTVNGREYQTCNETCVALNLVRNDFMWIECMDEAKAMKMPHSMRDLFCNIVIHCNPADKKGLFELYEDAMMDDYVRRRSRAGMSHC